jgi:hypothetical protein
VKVFDGLLGVAYSQAYVQSPGHDFAFNPDFDPHVFHRGQRNGLLGAGLEGVLHLSTGKQDGEVGLSVHVVEKAEVLDDSWEECVEASFLPATPVVAVQDWDRIVVCEIPLGERSYRVRYTARGMDAGHAGAEIDVYGLWFWPSPTAPDAIIRQTSESAAYWHGAAAHQNELGL